MPGGLEERTSKTMRTASLQRHMEQHHCILERNMYTKKCVVQSFLMKCDKGKFNQRLVDDCNGGGKDNFGI